MFYLVETGLFESSQGVITCLKLAESIDKSMTNSPKMRAWLDSKSVMTCADDAMTLADSVKTCAELDKNRLDKNRKEDNKDIKPSARAKAPAKTDDSQIMAYMPLPGDKQYELKQSQTDKWLDLYPGIDIGAEVRKMIGWLDANPTKRKTSRGILKFMNNWLSRAQDNGQQYQPQQQAQHQQVNTGQFMDELQDQIERSEAAKLRIEARGGK